MTCQVLFVIGDHLILAYYLTASSSTRLTTGPVLLLRFVAMANTSRRVAALSLDLSSRLLPTPFS